MVTGATRLRRRSRLALLACALLTVLGGAAAVEDPRADLERLRERIEALKDRLQAQRGEKDRVVVQLSELEREVGRLARELAATEARIARQRERRAEVQADIERQAGRVRRHRAALEEQVRAFYQMGEMHSLKLLLSQEDATVLSRMLQYAGYVSRARTEAVSAATAAIEELDRLQRDLERVESELASERERMLGERAELESTRQSRARVLRELEQALRSGDRRLASMRDEEETLQKLVISIGELLEDVPAAPYERQPFESLAGRLPWPTQGQVRASYNSWRSRGQLRWKGLLIGAETGSPVRAVYYGQVVFADWLPGFGLLLIVDHGDGYMTLYGHNQALAKATGDWVEPGEVIATVGDSGGQTQTGLYFEVRKAGKPVNPTRWIGRRYRSSLN